MAKVFQTIAVLLLGILGANETTADGLTVDPNMSIRPMLPESAFMPGEPVAADADATAQRAALESSPLHHGSFWVVRVDGDTHARNVVFLIPQYHHNALLPIAWTRLGKEITAVQGNIDTLVTHLVHIHRLRCLGSEGSSQYRIRRSPELQQLARWHRDLQALAESALGKLASDTVTAKPLIDALLGVLLPAIEQRFLILDGAGMAQGRLEDRDQLRRFGLEEEEVNARALQLLNELSDVEDELATLVPGEQPAANDALGKVWLAQIAAYDQQTLAPLRAFEPKLHALRKEITTAGIDDAADTLGRFISLAKWVVKEVVMPDVVHDATVHFMSVKRATQRRGSGKSLTAAQRRRRDQLVARRSQLNRTYAAVAHADRDRIAAERVIEQLALQPNDAPRTCAVVMGTGHEQGLSEKLLQIAQAKKLGPLAVIVVAPFAPAD